MNQSPAIAVYHNLGSGGAKRALYEFCRVLSRRGCRVDAFVPRIADAEFLPLAGTVRSETILPFTRRALPMPPIFGVRGAGKGLAEILNLYRFERAQREFAHTINRGGYDVVFVHHCSVTQAPSILQFLEQPSLYFCQEPIRAAYEAPLQEELAYERQILSPSQRFLNRSLLNPQRFLLGIRKRKDFKNTLAATMLACNSDHASEVILRTYGRSAHKIPLGVDGEKFKPLNLPREKKVLSVGGFDQAKGFRFLIRSLSLIEEKERPPLVLVGDRREPGEKEVLRRLAEEKRVKVTLLEGLSDSELVEHYNRASLVVYAPYLEPFGFVPLEAMACGTPVVGVREGGVRESVVHGETGLLVERDVGEFAAATRELLGDESRRAAFGRAGARHVREHWSWEESTNHLLALLQKTIDKARRRA